MIRIRTCRRLHFGLLSPLPVSELDLVYGGLGVMVDAPGVEVTVEHAGDWQIKGDDPSTVSRIVSHLKSRFPDLVPLKLEVHRHAPAHQGWGTGTQLALAVAQACCLACSRPWNAAEMACATGRGSRSGIGIVGYEQGGFLFDHGKSAVGMVQSPVVSIPFPAAWTFVLVEPGQEQGLFAESERSAFSQLQQAKVDVVRQMQCMIRDQILPAVQNQQFENFARALTEYNRLAGTHYHSVQGGDYSSELNATRLETMKQAGAIGLGQSSWGPGLFAVFRDEAAAQLFISSVKLSGCTLRMAKVKGALQPVD